jgi:predicted small secreted protein
MKKSIILLAMALLSVFALTACNPTKAASDGNALASGGNAYVSGGNAASYVMPFVSSGNGN